MLSYIFHFKHITHADDFPLNGYQGHRYYKTSNA